jgi:hypothetical protein
VADSIKKLGGCSVTPTSAAKFDWPVGIFATTVTLTGLAANAAAKQVNCQNLIAPCPPNIFLVQRFDSLGVLFLWRNVPLFQRGQFLLRHVAYLPPIPTPKRAFSAIRKSSRAAECIDSGRCFACAPKWRTLRELFSM